MKVFIASSKESIDTMRTISRWIEAFGHDPLEWDSPQAFIAGNNTLSRIIELSREVDAAVFVFGEDDRVWYRDSKMSQPRDNVLIEYGLFAGVFGQERALICRTGRPKHPSDLDGIVQIDMTKEADARLRIREWINHIKGGRRPIEKGVIPIVAENRHTLDPYYKERKYDAGKVDVLGIALSSAFEELATDADDRLLKRVLFEKVQVRLMFLSPRSTFVDQRSMEDGDDAEELREMLRTSVSRVVDLSKRFSLLYDANTTTTQSIGALEVRVTDYCPHFTLYRIDNTVLWGIYTSATRGDRSAVLEVQQANESLFNQLTEHFEKLWHISDRNSDKGSLLKCHSRKRPSLNQELVRKLLS